MDQNAVRSIMKKIVWDYNVDPFELYEVVIGKRERVGHFNGDSVMLRMLERLSWYDLLDILGLERLKSKLKIDLIAQIRNPAVRERYEFIRKFLLGEPVPFSGWDHEHRERVAHTLLSNRWYRAG